MKTAILYDEIKLVHAMIGGDQRAFDAIYLHYYRPVYQTIHSILKNRDLSEDILQDTFLTLWEKRSTLKSPGNIAGWLFISASNKSLNHLRAQLRRKMNSHPLESFRDIPYIPDTIDFYEEQMMLLKKAIETLPPRQKKVFELCKLQGKSLEETACELNISRNTAKTHMQRAKENINTFILSRPEVTLFGSAIILSLASPF